MIPTIDWGTTEQSQTIPNFKQTEGLVFEGLSDLLFW